MSGVSSHIGLRSVSVHVYFVTIFVTNFTIISICMLFTFFNWISLPISPTALFDHMIEFLVLSRNVNICRLM